MNLSPRGVALVFASFLAGVVFAAEKNGFNLDGALVPVKEIHRGGPPRDGIPAITRPIFVEASEADFLDPDDRILAYADGSVVRAYPVRILNWHEVVNDEAEGRGLLVTYCPLCGTGMAFEVDPGETFGVSGLLYNSDVLLYDRVTESLWSQIMGQAVTGPRRGDHLKQIPLRHTIWSEWLDTHPQTRVLAPPSGRRDYRVNPYEGYERTRRLYFRVSNRDRAFHPKEQVLGVIIDGKPRAYPFSELELAGATVTDRVEGALLRVHFNPESRSAWVERRSSRSYDDFQEVPGIVGFWFAWYGFHPDTSVYRHSGD